MSVILSDWLTYRRLSIFIFYNPFVNIIISFDYIMYNCIYQWMEHLL